MALMTPEQFETSLKGRKPRVFMNGKRVDSVLENPNTRTVVEANKASYQWALDPKYKDIMTCQSPLIGETRQPIHSREREYRRSGGQSSGRDIHV